MYGLKFSDLKAIQKKHKVQRDYLNNHFFVGQTGQVKNLIDVSFSANHSKRYYAEIINKINTINEIIATDLIQYQPIFITVTLDGFFRDFLKGNFKRYNEDKHFKLIPNNERFGFLRDKIQNKEKFTIKELYNVLNFQLNRFQKSSKYMRIKKDGYKAHYVKCVEPHKKDGVPHLHMMLYVPKIYLHDLLNLYKQYFPTSQNIKKLPNCDKGQVNGFQWEIKSAPAYILKYLFKSFLDVENESELDFLQAWYIKNRILRCVTSHSLVPAWVYRKIMPLETDWHYLTDIRNNGVCEWSKIDDYFRFEDEENRVLTYDKGIFTLYRKDRLIKKFGTKKEAVIKINASINLKYKKGIKEPKIEIDGTSYILKDNKLQKLYIKYPIKYTTTIELYKDYRKMEHEDIEKVDLNHYALVKNELIKRKSIKGLILPLTDYQTNEPEVVYYDDTDDTSKLMSYAKSSSFVFKKISY